MPRSVPHPGAPARAPLRPRQREALACLVAAGALGISREVAAAATRARAARTPPAALREALLLLVPYAGHPRALAAFRAAGSVGGKPRAAEVPARSRGARGRRAFDRVYGPYAGRVLAGLAALDPCLPAWTVEHAYGRVLARPGLSLLERELLALALLTALGGLEDALLGHMRGAARLGASPADLRAAVDAPARFVPPGRRRAAHALLERSGPA